MSYTQMNSKFTSVDDTVANKVMTAVKDVRKFKEKVIVGVVNWNSSTSSGGAVVPVLDKRGQPIQIPVGSLVNSVVLRQVGNDVSGARALAGATTVQLWLTNLNASNVYTVADEAPLVTPSYILNAGSLPTAATIGMTSTGYYTEFTTLPVSNVPKPLNTKQATILCAQLSGAATNASSQLQVLLKVLL